MNIDAGIPCAVCGWARWRETVERFVVRNRAGEVVRCRDGTRTRLRARCTALRWTLAGFWACRACVARCGLVIS